MKVERTQEVLRLLNRFGGDELILVKGQSKYFTIEYAGVLLVLDSTDLFDLIEMLKEVYKEVK